MGQKGGVLEEGGVIIMGEEGVSILYPTPDLTPPPPFQYQCYAVKSKSKERKFYMKRLSHLKHKQTGL